MSNLVSVIIPCFNRPSLLAQAVASCALQTWPSLEIIVVDDGSDEDLPAALNASAARGRLGDRLRYVRQERRGGNAARNAGLATARGEFIQFLDSDDLLHPDKIQRQMDRLTGGPDLDMVFALDELFAAVPGDRRILWNVPARADCSSDLDRYLHEDVVWQTGSPLWRRASLTRVGPWAEELQCWQDWEYHLRALSLGIRYDVVGDVLQYVRYHDGPRISGRLPVLVRERHCLLAGQLVHRQLASTGMLDDSRRALLLGYFLRHLSAVARRDGAEARALARDFLAAMKDVAGTSRRRTAVSVLQALSGTPLFRRGLSRYERATAWEARLVPLRDTVRATFLPAPPRAIVDVAVPRQS